MKSHNSRHNLASLLFLTVAAALCACNRQTIYSHYESIGSDGWGRNDSLLFESDPVRESGIYEELLGLRLTDAYPFTNLAVIVDRCIIPNGDHHSDTIQLTLANEHDHMQGRGGHHQLLQVPIGQQYMKEDQKLRVSVRHFMTQSTLPGITDVGLTVKIK